MSAVAQDDSYSFTATPNKSLPYLILGHAEQESVSEVEGKVKSLKTTKANRNPIYGEGGDEKCIHLKRAGSIFRFHQIWPSHTTDETQ